MIELKIPKPGESINEVVLSNWYVENGSFVEKNQEVGEIESDKATLPLIAPENGIISILVKKGTTTDVGTIACLIDTESKKVKAQTQKKAENKKLKGQEIIEMHEDLSSQQRTKNENSIDYNYKNIKITPLAKIIMKEKGLTLEDVIDGLKRIGKDEINGILKMNENSPKVQKDKSAGLNSEKLIGTRELKRVEMTQLRKKLSKRLVAAKNETAMLTTFNEVDMSEIMALRNKYQKSFTEKHGVKLGFMSFFTKVSTISLNEFPRVNSMIDGDDIVTPSFVDIGIAIQADKGLMVSILRNTETMSIPEIEKKLAQLAEKARAGRLSIEEMTGGTFTITNGGVFGSLFSTPIINPPQAAILGMHNIVDRPVAINKNVEIRPMMYVALSYDHRIIDGKEAVGFLVRIKELLESPFKMLLEGENPEKLLLDL